MSITGTPCAPSAKLAKGCRPDRPRLSAAATTRSRPTSSDTRTATVLRLRASASSSLTRAPDTSPVKFSGAQPSMTTASSTTSSQGEAPARTAAR